MVYRPQLAVELVPLAPDEFAWLEALAQGRTMGNALAHVLAEFPRFDIEEILQKHLRLQTFRQ